MSFRAAAGSSSHDRLSRERSKAEVPNAVELFVLFVAALPFIVSFTRLSRLTRRMNDAEALLEQQQRDIERIGRELRDARREAVAAPPVKAAEPAPAKPAAPPPKPATPPGPPV